MNILNEDQVEYIQMVLRQQMCRAGKRLALVYESIYNKIPAPSDFWFIMIAFVVLLSVIVIDEVYHGGSCSKQR